VCDTAATILINDSKYMHPAPVRSRLGRRSILAGATALATSPGTAFSAPTDFRTWLQGLRAEASSKGISRPVLDDALAGLQPIARVIELDRRQPESVQTLAQYLATRLTTTKIENGRKRLADNAALLARVEQRFKVQARYIVALWGMESDYGRFMGDFPIVGALATLAHDGRRSAFFREELLNALRILERKRMRSTDLRGSWAGAMGQCQFMPSNYLAYAIDLEGDGKADIWGDLADVFASMGNFLGKLGWRGDEHWGYEVELPAGFDRGLVDPDNARRPIAEWQSLGVRRLGGGPLPGQDPSAGLSQPDGAGTRAFLTTTNFRVLRRWNTPQRFRIAVGLLADRIGAA
jgi:membrane-bound lytic murein transglycosylase B